MKLALGTVQFGMDYGINNKEGKVTKEEVFRILNFALENNIDVLDTATAYNCEETLGEYTNINKFKIISKTSENIEIKNSLKKLKQKKLLRKRQLFILTSRFVWHSPCIIKSTGQGKNLG